VHARVVRPPAIGAELQSVDETSVQGMPGLVKVVRLVHLAGSSDSGFG
jgi:urease beta subunit